MRQHLYQCLEKGYLLPFFIKRRRALKEVVTVYSFDVYCICRMPEMHGRGWEVGRMHKCLRWYHTDKCLNISQESLGLPWLFVLGTFHPFRYHAFHFYPCMHVLFNISSIFVSCTCLYPFTCLSLVCHSCTFSTLALSYSCTITVCLIHSLANMYGVPFVSKLLFNFLIILMKNASFAKYRSMFSKGRSMFSKCRSMFSKGRSMFSKYRSVFSKYRSMFSKDRSMFLTMDAGFINIIKNRSFDTNGTP